MNAVERSGKKSSRVRAISVASVGESGVPLDDKGDPTFHALAWYDSRTQDQFSRLERSIGLATLAKRTGLNPEPNLGIFKLLWLKENQPEAYTRTTRWLHLADYINYRLSGHIGTDYSLACTTFALDLHHRRWADDLLLELGIAPKLFAPLVRNGSPLGKILPKAALEAGLPDDVLVVVGGHDHVCGAVAAGGLVPGTMLDSIGTAEAILFALDRPVADPNRLGYQQGILFADRPIYYIVGWLYSVGASIEWFMKLIRDQVDYAVITAEAQAVSATSQGVGFLPHLYSSSSPAPDVHARGAFIGLSQATTRGVLFRAILEGLAYEAKQVRDGLLAFPEIGAQNGIRVIGGSVQNDLFMRIKASIYGQPISVTKVSEACSLGAALLAGSGAGFYRNLEEASKSVDLGLQTVEPNKDWTDVYAEYFNNVYSRFRPSLQPLNYAATNIKVADISASSRSI
jgi:xylulokinase